MTTGRITGKGSGHLMQMESNYGFDNRFQLDNTFMEDGDKEVSVNYIIVYVNIIIYICNFRITLTLNVHKKKSDSFGFYRW